MQNTNIIANCTPILENLNSNQKFLKSVEVLKKNLNTFSHSHNGQIDLMRIKNRKRDPSNLKVGPQITEK